MKKIMKAFTLSYDDGVESDKRFVELVNKYNLKCTFNLNSGIMYPEFSFKYINFDVRRMSPIGIKNLYAGHEIAIHGRYHKNPQELIKTEEYEEEFLLDKIRLEDIFEQKITGCAYAFGKYDDKTVDFLKSIGIKYSRTVEKTNNFNLQTDLLRFNPTNHHKDKELSYNVDKFINMEEPDTPQIFYLWGHSYEFDAGKDGSTWENIENIFKRVSNRDDIFYGTNRQVFEYYGLI